uniref:Uncharacterized protein n=1 Tax=Glossina pallidipes TaxID=7398 RepID=A0A1A9Z534_GLOPL
MVDAHIEVHHIAYDVYDDDAVLKLKKQLSKLQGLATMNTMEFLPELFKNPKEEKANANIQRSEEDNQNLEHEILTKPDLKCAFNTTVTTATSATTTLSENIFSCNARFYTTTTINATTTNTITTTNITDITTTTTATTCSPSTLESFPFSNDFGNNVTGGDTTTATATDAIGNFKLRDEFYESSTAAAGDTARNNCNGQTLVMPSNLNRSKNNGERRNNEKSIDDVGVVRKFADFSTKSPNTNFEMLNEMPKTIEEDNSGQQRFHMTNEINVNRNAKERIK